MNLKGEVPENGHLVLITGKGTGIAIKTGHTMMIVADPLDAARNIPVILVKVTRDKIHFRCACGEPECTRVLTYSLSAKGFHPQKT